MVKRIPFTKKKQLFTGCTHSNTTTYYINFMTTNDEFLLLQLLDDNKLKVSVSQLLQL